MALHFAFVDLLDRLLSMRQTAVGMAAAARRPEIPATRGFGCGCVRQVTENATTVARIAGVSDCCLSERGR